MGAAALAALAAGGSAWLAWRSPVARVFARDGTALKVLELGKLPRLAPSGYAGHQALPSPHGSMWAAVHATPGGVDVAVLRGEADTVAVLTDPADEVPLAWSPDERWLALSHTRAAGGTVRERLRLAALDGTGGDLFVELPELAWRIDWSPDGSRLAVTLKSRRVRVVALDGEARDVDADGVVSARWRPDALEIALLHDDVLEIRGADLSTARLRLGTAGRSRDCAWLDDRFLVVLLEQGGVARLQVVDGRSGATAVLPGPLPGTVGSLEPAPKLSPRARSRLARWFDRLGEGAGPLVAGVRLRGHGVHRAVGETFRVEAAIEGVDAGVIPRPTVPIRWSADGTVVRSLGEGRFLAASEGVGFVTASVSGWREARSSVRVGRLQRAAANASFTERWERPFEGEWLGWGDPLPRRAWAEGLPGSAWALDVNGDGNYASGVVSRRSFAAAAGVSVEVQAWMPFDGSVHQEWGIGLAPTAAFERFRTDPVALSGLVAATALSAGGLWTYPGGQAPWSGRNGWRRIVLQISADGAVWLLDGRTLLGRGTIDPVPERVHVVLFGRSVGGPVLHGALGVYEAPLARVEGPRVGDGG